jgi:hypothetical protein
MVLALASLPLFAGCSASGGESAPTGNGAATMDAPALLRETLSAAQQETSYRYVAALHCQSTAYAVDMKVARDGHADGTVAIGAEKLRVKADGQYVYVKAPAAFWAAQTSLVGANFIGDRWVRWKSGEGSVCISTMTKFSDVLANYLQLDGTPKNGGPGRVAGKEAVVLTLPTATVWVAATGKPLPLGVSLAAQDGSTEGDDRVDFGEWGGTVLTDPPATGQVVEPSSVPTK